MVAPREWPSSSPSSAPPSTPDLVVSFVDDLFLDLLLPETDRGAITQWVVMAIVWTGVLLATRGWRREYRLFLIGLAVMNIAWFAVRTVH